MALTGWANLYADTGETMFDSVKANLFTVPGLVVTVIHVFVAVGFITCYVLFQTQIMGVDPMAPIAETSTKGRR
jgi:hypothetical protein